MYTSDIQELRFEYIMSRMEMLFVKLFRKKFPLIKCIKSCLYVWLLKRSLNNIQSHDSEMSALSLGPYRR